MSNIELPLQSMKNVYIPARRPAYLARSIALMKPITWFAPMWAFLCGAIASGATVWELPQLGTLFLGIVMAGPILTGVSQVFNDYFDRDIDAVNEPHRLIPAGLVSNQQIFGTIFVLTVVGMSIAAYLGMTVLLFVGVGLVLAVAYSAPPIRAKRNGWIGNTLVAIAYEGLAWLAGHAAFGDLTTASVFVALMYSFGTHGIMSINDYKSIEGDRKGNIRTIPVQLGPKRAAWMIAITMNLAQIGVVAAFAIWGQWVMVAVLVGVILIQLPLQKRFIEDSLNYYLKFSAIGVSFFVWGMIFAAVGLRHI